MPKTFVIIGINEKAAKILYTGNCPNGNIEKSESAKSMDLRMEIWKGGNIVEALTNNIQSDGNRSGWKVEFQF